MRYLLLPLFAILAITPGCGSSATSSKTSESAEVTEPQGDTQTDLELPLPVIPDNLQTGIERADYAVTHFWDPMDFTDTIRSHSETFIEQNFVNFITFFPYASEEGRQAGVRNMVKKAEADGGALKLAANVADLYLYEPNSPYFSEDYYIVFLREFTKSDKLDEAHAERLNWQLESAQKNRPGDQATDFSFKTPDGQKYNLLSWNPDAESILIVFFDPDCDKCKDTLHQLMDNQTINGMIVAKKLAVLAIDPDYNEDLWKQTADTFPATWTVGYENGAIEEDDLYVLRALPSLYLLDKEKRIILKDATLQEITEYFIR